MKNVICLIFILSNLLICNISISQNARDYYESGVYQLQLQDYNAALADLTKAIELDSTYVNAYYLRGDIKDDLKDYKGAISDYTNAIKYNAKYKDAFYNRGCTYYKLGDAINACNDWNSALNLGAKSVKKLITKLCPKN